MSSRSASGNSKRKLGDFFRIKHGHAFKGEFFASEGPYVLLTPGNFYDDGGFKLKGDKEKHYVGPVPPDFVLSEGDLIVAMTEQAEGLLGSSAWIPKDGTYLHNQRLGLIQSLDESKLNKRFLYYLFNTPEVRAQIRATANGAKVRHTSPSRIYDVSFNWLPLRAQRFGADTLLAYDRLIDNNNRRIRVLAEMAAAIYREWFVHFRFPGLQTSRMMKSPMGSVPEGWEVRPIGDEVVVLGGGTPSTKNADYWENGNVIWYSPTDLTGSGSMFIEDSAKHITELGLAESSARLFPAHSVMLTSRATIGAVSINTKPATTNQGFIVCVPSKRLSAYQLYWWMRENKEMFLSHATGATFKELGRTVFRKFNIVVPDEQTASRFMEMVDPLGKLLLTLQRKNAVLQTTRDLLLPKLISGEVA